MPEVKMTAAQQEKLVIARDPFGLWACRKLLIYLRQFGVKETLGLLQKNISYLMRQYRNWRFDRKFHVDTSGLIELATLTSESENKQFGIRYEPTPIRTLEWMFSSLPANLSDWTFVDFGSGKGRTILYASNNNFRRIIGVEFTQELHAIAEKNIASYRSKRQKCLDVRSVCMDAARFPIPDGNCILYFFRPFREEVMAAVIENLQQAYRRDPARKLMVYYYHPLPDSSIEKQTFLRKRDERPMPFDISAEPSPYRRRLAVYET
jgi:SAM-dependent methyltransferase